MMSVIAILAFLLFAPLGARMVAEAGASAPSTVASPDAASTAGPKYRALPTPGPALTSAPSVTPAPAITQAPAYREGSTPAPSSKSGGSAAPALQQQ